MITDCNKVSTPPAELEVSESPLERDEDNYFGHLNPKSETRSTKQILMTKILWIRDRCERTGIGTMLPIAQQIKFTPDVIS
jgi:hypothetical protein